MKSKRIVLALAAVAVAALAAGTLVADDAGDGRTKLRLMLDRDGTPDQLVVEDLGTMEVGESRSFSTEAGKPVTVTRGSLASPRISPGGLLPTIQNSTSGQSCQTRGMISR